MSTQTAYSPAEVARLSGLDSNTVRNLSNGPLKPHLDAERTAVRPRQYSERDLQILTLVRRWHVEQKLSYPEIAERFETNGIDRCLQEVIGADAFTQTVAADNRALMERQVQLTRDLEVARDLIAKQREFQARTQVALVHLDRHMAEQNAELIYARNALARAQQNEEAALDAVRTLGLWGWLFGGRRELVVRLEQATQARQEAADKVAATIESMQTFQVQELQRLLGLTTDAARQGDVIEVPAPVAPVPGA